MPPLIISCILITFIVELFIYITIKTVGTCHVEPNKHENVEPKMKTLINHTGRFV